MNPIKEMKTENIEKQPFPAVWRKPMSCEKNTPANTSRELPGKGVAW
jgi:hypothetical protein